MYKAKSDNSTFDIELNQGQCVIDGKKQNVQFRRLGKDELMLSFNGKEQNVLFHSYDIEKKLIVLFIQGKRHEVQIQEPVDLLLEKLGMQNMRQKRVKNLKAPMPGLVLKVLVEEGQEVPEGTPLLVLEAMKMENIYKASAQVRIGKILVKAGVAVEKNQELVQFA